MRATRTSKRRAGRLGRTLRVVLPFAISAALFAYLFARVDARAVGDAITMDIVMRWVPALLLFNLVTLGIEAVCLSRVTNVADATLDHWTAARIKAACYLLSVLNYAAGAAGLSVLLRRRAKLGLGDAASIVFLISLFDIGAVLGLAAIGATFLETDALGIRIGLIVSLIACIVAGFVFLRVPLRLGLLESLRRLDVFRAPRTASFSILLELGLLRILFVGCYVALAGSLFWAFGIEVDTMRLSLNVAILLAVSALPIAAGGLGTGQWVFIELFRDFGSDAELLAASLVFSLGLISSRALLGWIFALEFTREALDENRRSTTNDA
jgi:Lysylphosphatidylglycerol synthase TM region